MILNEFSFFFDSMEGIQSVGPSSPQPIAMCTNASEAAAGIVQENTVIDIMVRSVELYPIPSAI